MNEKKETEEGFDDGSVCNRNGCNGIIENFWPGIDECNCRIHPQCKKCMYACTECDYIFQE